MTKHHKNSGTLNILSLTMLQNSKLYFQTQCYWRLSHQTFFYLLLIMLKGLLLLYIWGGGQKTFALLWRLLIFSTSRNSHNESQQTGALNWVSPYIISAIYSSEAVAMRLWCHLRMWNVNLIHSHYLPELIWEPFVHINQKISKEDVPISPRKTSSWFQLTSLPLSESYLWGVMKSSRSRAVEKKGE